MKTFQMPFTETNLVPSLAVFDDPTKGAKSQMQPSPKEPTFNGQKIDDLRSMSFLAHHDKLDQLGLATRELDQQVKTYKRSAFHSQFTKLLTQQKKR